jgi:hypothetical protein
MYFASLVDTQEKREHQERWKGIAWLRLRGSNHAIRFPLERTADNG